MEKFRSELEFSAKKQKEKKKVENMKGLLFFMKICITYSLNINPKKF